MNKWTIDELKLARALYCQIPFGKMHSRNPDVIRLADKIGRTSSAVAMKLVNFASLDPEIIASGRTGLGNASATDKMVWEEFQTNWDNELLKATKDLPGYKILSDKDSEEQLGISVITTRKAEVEIRTKQSIFRRMILSSYAGVCCISGLSEPKLLIASHIVPWNKDSGNRLNPHNGLCLSVLHDKAFDRGLITVLPDYTVAVSKEITKLIDDHFAQSTLAAINGQKIKMPEKFHPLPAFLIWHNQNIFKS
jgi:predicted restriction endonuclease